MTGRTRALKNIASSNKLISAMFLFLSECYFVTARKLVKLNLRSWTPFSRISRP